MKFTKNAFLLSLTVLVIAFALIVSAPTRKNNKQDATEDTGQINHYYNVIVPEDKLEKYKKGLVIVESKIDVPFSDDIMGTVETHGFIISVEKRLIAVPKKIATSSPSVIRITFHNKTLCAGTVIYSDMVSPFGIIMVDEACFNKEGLKGQLFAIPLGNTKHYFAAGDQIGILGYEYTKKGGREIVFKKGHIMNTMRGCTNRYCAFFESYFDHTSSFEGAPIFNDQALCVGMHIEISENQGYDLKIEYIGRFLAYYLNDKFDGRPYKRGDIGVSISLKIVGFEKVNNKFPADVGETIINAEKPSGGPPTLMVINSIIPGFEDAERELQKDDIIFKVDGIQINEDFLLLDEIIDSKVGQLLDIEFYRAGEKKSAKIKVIDTNIYRIKRYVQFGGSYFHDITPYVKANVSIESKSPESNIQGVYLTQNTPKGSFSSVATQNNLSKTSFILTKLNSVKINKLDDFIEYFKKECSSQSIEVEGIDLHLNNKLVVSKVDLPFDSFNLIIYTMTDFGGWSSSTINLTEYCKDRTEGFITKQDDPTLENNANPTSVADHSTDSKTTETTADNTTNSTPTTTPTSTNPPTTDSTTPPADTTTPPATTTPPTDTTTPPTSTPPTDTTTPPATTSPTTTQDGNEVKATPAASRNLKKNKSDKNVLSSK